MGSFVRYVYCSLQFCISLGQLLLEFRNFILVILSYLFSRYFVFVVSCVSQPQELAALQLSLVGGGIRSLFFAQSGFGFSYPAVPYLSFFV